MKRVLAVVALSVALESLVLVPVAGRFGSTPDERSVAAVYANDDVAQPQPPAPPPGPAPAPVAQPPAVQEPDWYDGNAFTIDACESRPERVVLVGGRVASDSMLGQDVWVSRGARSQTIGIVRPDGTYQGETVQNFAAFGQLVTVAIRPRNGRGACVYTCQVDGFSTESNPEPPFGQPLPGRTTAR